jgi:hypothetical protein
MERSETTWVNYFALDHAHIQLHFHLQKLTRALQAAHLRQLLVDLLDSKQLWHIFDTAACKAKTHHYQLMLHHPSNLFLIETSYVHNGHDINLILHMEMSVANLMSCHRINSAYLCEQHGVMRRELNSTCLGSLYVQDFPGAMTLCEMRIVEQTETVLQLQENWYLVYSPTAFTSYIICLNNSNSEVFVKTGPNRIYISPSCRMRLKDHVLISDFSLGLDSVIKHYEWDLDEIAFSSEERAIFSHWLEIFRGRKCWSLYAKLYLPRHRY